ncbi:MAG: hypothetical protein GF344_11370 [Chitinivibrionales bacterium]|nr:hypothetical protein [Chitinivibrionales bacterium]MBD3357400.1 hypothetical protein [Chitinivibrionales bacterium]
MKGMSIVHAILFFSYGYLVTAPHSGYAATTVEELDLRVKELEERLRKLEARVNGVQEESVPSTASAAKSSRSQNYIVPELMVKKIHGAGAGDEGELRFYIRLKNNYGRDVTSFDGVFVLENLAGSPLLEFAASIRKAIAGGNTTSWVGAIDIDGTDEGQHRVMRASKEDLVLKLSLKSVTFADGSMQTFDNK